MSPGQEFTFMQAYLNSTSMNVNASPVSADIIQLTQSRHPVACRTTYPKNKPLADDYEPHEYDVICGKGKTIFSREGNRVFRQSLEANAGRYNQAKTKMDKSLIVVEIVDSIRKRSPNGGFVKQVKAKKGTQRSESWVEIGDALAREKVGHTLRDIINGKQISCGNTTYQPKSKLCRTFKKFRSNQPYARKNLQDDEVNLLRASIISYTEEDQRSDSSSLDWFDFDMYTSLDQFFEHSPIAGDEKPKIFKARAA
jgi:hypothetical protein